MTDPETEAQRRALFELLGDPETVVRFFDHVADDVEWTVEGTHPIAGTYTDKRTFNAATFGRLGRVMRDRVRLQLLRLHLAGDIAVAELRAGSTTLDGAPYDNHLCWVCRFDGDTVVEVRAYLDSAMVSWVLSRNESNPDVNGAPPTGAAASE